VDVLLPTILEADFPAVQIIRAALTLTSEESGKKRKRRGSLDVDRAYEVAGEVQTLLDGLKLEWAEANPQLAAELGVLPMKEWEDVSSISASSRAFDHSEAKEKECQPETSVPHTVRRLEDESDIAPEPPFEALKGVEDLPHWSDAEAEREESEQRAPAFSTSAPRLLYKRAQRQEKSPENRGAQRQEQSPENRPVPLVSITKHKRSRSECKRATPATNTDSRPKSAEVFKRKGRAKSCSSFEKENLRTRSVSVGLHGDSEPRWDDAVDFQPNRRGRERSRSPSQDVDLGCEFRHSNDRRPRPDRASLSSTSPISRVSRVNDYDGSPNSVDSDDKRSHSWPPTQPVTCGGDRGSTPQPGETEDYTQAPQSPRTAWDAKTPVLMPVSVA